MPKTPSELLELEMQYTPWDWACRDAAAFGEDLRQCRRTRGHEGKHASGFKAGLKEWE